MNRYLSFPRLPVLALLLGSLITTSFAARPPLVVPLWPDGVLPPAASPEVVKERGKNPAHPNRSITNISQPTLTITWPDNVTGPAPCTMLCPGGGYDHVVIDKEGTDLAAWFNQQGLVAAVLKYRLPDGIVTAAKIPFPLADAQRALRLIRAHAVEWGIQPDRLIIVGSSAGGHLAATVSTHFDAGNPNSPDPVERQSSRPDFQILRYPVITLVDKSIAHIGSRNSLLGPNPTDETLRFYSLELQVTAQTPPAFVSHAKDDKGVPCQNSILYAEALKKHGVPCDLYLLETGGHGFNTPESVQNWLTRCTLWLKANNLSSPAKG